MHTTTHTEHNQSDKTFSGDAAAAGADHAGGGTATIELAVEGMHCASCSARVEKVLRNVPGVSSASVSLPHALARIEVSGGDVSLTPERLARTVQNLGYEATPITRRASVAQMRSAIEQRQSASARAWRNRALVGVIASIPMLPAHLPFLSSLLPAAAHEHAALTWYTWMTFVLASVVQVYVGGAFYRSAWKAAKNFATNMDTLVSIGATAAYGFSLVLLVMEIAGIAIDQPLYFAEAAGLLTLISIGHYLEARTTAAAGSAIRDLLALQPDEVTRLNNISDTSGAQIPSSEIVPGDFMLVTPGERIAVDGEIVRGVTTADETIVTGESMPVDKALGASVIAGSLNISAAIVVKATTTGMETTVARIAEMVRRAQSSKAEIQRLADYISSIFVPAVLAIAAVTFLSWWIIGGMDQPHFFKGLISATTVLIISCPCALGLATPTAVMVGSGAASSRGVLVKGAGSLERAARITDVVFDKTGTLTVGRPEVTSVTTDETLRLAAALAVNSSHPLSRAIVRAANQDHSAASPALVAGNVTEQAGRGLQGDIDGQDVQLISLTAARQEGLLDSRFDDFSDEGRSGIGTTSVVIRAGKMVGSITMRDQLRDTSQRLIQSLSDLNIRTHLATGDRRAVAHDIAGSIGLPVELVHAELKPEDKLNLIRSIRARDPESAVVAMVGDGINDAAALAAASSDGGVAVALGTGANIAIESADVVIPGDNLHHLVDLITISRQSLRTIKQNLFFSFFYNASAIPAAALGLLGVTGPLIAAAAMAGSDICVIGNSLRLKWKLARRYRTQSG